MARSKTVVASLREKVKLISTVAVLGGVGEQAMVQLSTLTLFEVKLALLEEICPLSQAKTILSPDRAVKVIEVAVQAEISWAKRSIEIIPSIANVPSVLTNEIAEAFLAPRSEPNSNKLPIVASMAKIPTATTVSTNVKPLDILIFIKNNSLTGVVYGHSGSDLIAVDCKNHFSANTTGGGIPI